MKRLICAALCLILALSLVACKGPEPLSSSSSALPVNEQFLTSARLGQIGGVPLGLGTKPQQVLDYYHFEDEEYWSNPENAQEGLGLLSVDYLANGQVRMWTEEVKYYYNEQQQDKGISFIAYFAEAYGYKNTSTANYIKSTAGIKPVYEGAASEDDLFFLYGGAVDTTMLAFNVDGKYAVDFYFFNSMLVATTISEYDSQRVYGPTLSSTSSAQ